MWARINRHCGMLLCILDSLPYRACLWSIPFHLQDVFTLLKDTLQAFGNYLGEGKETTRTSMNSLMGLRISFLLETPGQYWRRQEPFNSSLTKNLIRSSPIEERLTTKTYSKKGPSHSVVGIFNSRVIWRNASTIKVAPTIIVVKPWINIIGNGRLGCASL